MKNIVKFGFFALSFTFIFAGCDSEKTKPENQPDIKVDSLCQLKTIYREVNSDMLSTKHISNGYGAKKVEYREFKVDTLIAYWEFEYNSNGSPTLIKEFNSEGVQEIEKTIEYWPNGKVKLIKSETVDPSSLFDSYNAIQETYFDEFGNDIEYKNMSSGRTLMNHLVYHNHYSNNLLDSVYWEDMIYGLYYGIEIYKYNTNNLLAEKISKDKNSKIESKTTYEYDSNNREIEIKYYNRDGSQSRATKYTRNDNGVLLLQTNLDKNNAIMYQHHYEYDCQ